MTDTYPPGADNPYDLRNELRRGVRVQLRGVEIAPFSERGYRELQTGVFEYVEDVVAEASRIMMRHQSEQISKKDVEQARRHIAVGTRSLRRTLLDSCAGIVLGGALGNLLAMVSTNSFSQAGVALTSIGLVGGAAVLGVQYALVSR